MQWKAKKNSRNTVYVTDIVEEGDWFRIAKGSDGAFRAISKGGYLTVYMKPFISCVHPFHTRRAT